MKRTLTFLFSWTLIAASPPPERSGGGMVATDHRLASRAGAAILAQGGNAVDAAVGAALACGVVQPSSSGLGGGGFALVVLPDGTAEILDFREVAPSGATRDMYVEAEDPQASRVGGMAVGVPGEPRGLVELHQEWGQLPLRQVAAPAVRLGRKGFAPGEHLVKALERREAQSPNLRCQLFDDCGTDEWVKRKALARTLQRYSRTEGQWLTVGEGAQDIVDGAVAAGGILTLEDLSAYEVMRRAPLQGSYRGWKVLTMPPPSSGGLVLLQALAVLELTDLQGLGHNSSELVHLYAEALKHGFADRAAYMGDPERIDVPVDALLDPARVHAIQEAFDPSRTFAGDFYGTRIDIGSDSGTQHISVLDKDGMAVSLTTTINTSFGSQVVTSGGLVLNNEMDDFVARPGEPNFFGLIGSEANAVAAGSRPLSSMSPTVLVSPDGERRIVVGASGGPFIISSTLQAIINVIDFEMSATEAVSVPRMHHQWVPDRVLLDVGFSTDTVRALEARGHRVEEMPFYSSVQLIGSDGGGVEAASDPRKGGWPAGE